MVSQTANGYTLDGSWCGFAEGRRSTGEAAVLVAGDESMQEAGGVSKDKKGAVGERGIGGDAFQEQAQAAIRDVRTTLLRMLESGGKQIVKSRDVQKLYGVDASLSWQMFKLFNAADVLGAVQYVPPAVSMQKIMAAAKGKGISAEAIGAADQAFQKFEQFVEVHAGGRGRFESMAAALSQGDDVKQAAEQHRRSLFKAHTFYWGVELGTMYTANILTPSRTNKGNCDIIHVANMIGFHRLRPNADTHVFGYGQTNSSAQTPPEPPLDPEAQARYGASVLPQFSTALPLLQTGTDKWGRVRSVLSGEAVGLTSSVDLAHASIIWNAGEYENDFIHRGGGVTVRPTERLYLEFLIHRKTFPKLSGTAEVFGHVSWGTAPEDIRNPAWQLPCFEKVTYESSVDDARLVGVPRRRELLIYCCEKMGWDVQDFDVYRLHMEYPMLDTNTVVALAPQK